MKIILVEEDHDVCELLVQLLKEAAGSAHTVIAIDNITSASMTEIATHHSDTAVTFISHGWGNTGALAGGFLKSTFPKMKVVLISTMDAQTAATNHHLDHFMFKQDFFPTKKLRVVLTKTLGLRL